MCKNGSHDAADHFERVEVGGREGCEECGLQTDGICGIRDDFSNDVVDGIFTGRRQLLSLDHGIGNEVSDD